MGLPGLKAEMKAARWGLEGTEMGRGESVFMGSQGLQGWDRAVSAHVDPAHIPGRCPHHFSLQGLLPKVWDHGLD